MRRFRNLVAAVVALAVVLAVHTSAHAAQKGKKKAARGFRGVVVEVKKEEGKKEGTIKVRSVPRKKGAAGEAAEKTFKFTEKTKFVTVTGRKADRQETPADVAALAEGVRVVILGTGDTAEEVKILARGKGKGKKKKNQDQ